MPDISIAVNDQTFAGDLQLAGGDLAQGDELVTSMYVSLFTSRGWWADAYEPDQIGSDLLTLRRSKRTQVTLNKARDYARACLAWLIEDGIARAVNVVTEWQGERLAIGITLVQPRGQVTRYAFVWAGV